MNRKVSQKDIEGLREWNESHPGKYVSIEDLQDLYDWMPNEISEEFKKVIFKDIGLLGL